MYYQNLKANFNKVNTSVNRILQPSVSFTKTFRSMSSE